MKIVVAVMSYYPHEGGVQTVTKYLAEGLAEKGHEVIVLTAQSAGDATAETYHQVHIKRFAIGTFLKLFPTGEQQAFRTALLDECRDADVFVNVCDNTPLAILVYQEIDHIRCRRVLHLHGMFDGHFHFRQCHTLREYIRRLLLTPLWELFHRYYWDKMTQFDACVHLFEQDSSHRYFVRHGYLHNHVVMNSCESTFFDGQSRQSVLEQYHITRPYFIYVANYSSNKNQLRAVKTYLSSGCQTTDLVLVGSSSNRYFRKIQSVLEQSPQKERVHLLSAVPRQDTIDLIKNAYAFLMTSNSEYYPISIIEAMACGKPFICTDVGVVSQLPGGKVCRSDRELADWMHYYEANPTFVSQTGAEARAYAQENCYLPQIISQFETICHPDTNR